MSLYRRKDDSDEAALICGGRLFHALATATGNARSPKDNEELT